ncbi:MAG: hypothetical protein IPO25_08760 [Saprospiraceae bacterium]|nr:hypothetical protein [Saprospiraceae bacterium]
MHYDHTDSFSDDRSPGCTLKAHGSETKVAKNQDVVENDIGGGLCYQIRSLKIGYC